MIIKTLRHSPDEWLVQTDIWEYWDKIRGLSIEKPLEADKDGNYKDHFRIRFTYGDGELFDQPIMKYQQIYLLNDNGKTIETIRNVTFSQNKITTKVLSDDEQMLEDINKAPNDFKVKSGSLPVQKGKTFGGSDVTY